MTKKKKLTTIVEFDDNVLRKRKFITLDDFISFVDNISSEQEMLLALDVICELNFKVKNKTQEALISDLLYKVTNWGHL